MKFLLRIFCIVVVFALCRASASAAMNSVNYQINWDSFNSGGTDSSTSTNYSVRDSIGQIAIGNGTSSNYQILQGYRAVDYPGALSLVVRTQESSVTTTYSAFNFAAKTVTVTSAASFATGDHIIVVENQGFQQKIAFGLITSVNGNVISVDKFDGSASFMSAIPAGGDDFVYRANGSSAGFGSILVGTANTAVTISSVVSSNPSGYSVYLQANHSLQNGSGHFITDVSDGTVVVGSEEYGANTTGTTALLSTSDFPILSTQQAVQNSGTITSSPADRVGLIYKLSVTSSTLEGTYSQTVYYTLTANY